MLLAQNSPGSPNVCLRVIPKNSEDEDVPVNVVNESTAQMDAVISEKGVPSPYKHDLKAGTLKIRLRVSSPKEEVPTGAIPSGSVKLSNSTSPSSGHVSATGSIVFKGGLSL